MYKTFMVLPDGTQLFSGAEEINAIKSITITECVNDSHELTLGSTCANMLEAKLITPGGGLSISAGDEITVYKVNEIGERFLTGIFIAEKPTRPSANSMNVTSYDRIIKLNKDLTSWLKELDGWPYRLIDFAGMVCEACGLELVTEVVPNGDFPVRQMSIEATGRQLMRWIGEVCCRFCRATPEGKIELGWYTPAGVSITPSGDSYYLQNSLSYEEYEVAPVDAVQLRLANDQSGVLWPEVQADSNSYIIEWNPILLASVTEGLLPVLDTIKAQMPATGYRPCKVSTPATLDIHAGNMVQITDKNGVTFSTYVMTKVQKGQKDTLECTGSLRRDSSTAQNNKTEQEKTAALKSYADRVAQEKADAAKKAAQADLVNFSQAVTGSINSLQSQIDGNITTWFDNYVPTTENEPASGWTTDALKNRHLGDLFYIVDNDQAGGQVYRWALTNGSYGWQRVEDTEVAKALADAAKAQDTADGKRRVFITQPVPPYDRGDLWAQGGSGDLMVCKTARATGSFVASDWELATDYINSETAGSIAQGKVDAQTQLDIFNKLTDNGKMEGLFMQDGQLFINASYVKSGFIDADLIKTGTISSEDNAIQIDLANNRFAFEVSAGGEPEKYVFDPYWGFSMYGFDGVANEYSRVLRIFPGRRVSNAQKAMSLITTDAYVPLSIGGGADLHLGSFAAGTKIEGATVEIQGKKVSWKEINGVNTLIGYENEEPIVQKTATLYSGTLDSGSVSFTGEYSQYVIVGYTTSNQCKVSLAIPAPACDGSLFQLYADGEWVSFNMSEDTLSISRVSNGGAITGIYGII